MSSYLPSNALCRDSDFYEANQGLAPSKPLGNRKNSFVVLSMLSKIYLRDNVPDLLTESVLGNGLKSHSPEEIIVKSNESLRSLLDHLKCIFCCWNRLSAKKVIR